MPPLVDEAREGRIAIYSVVAVLAALTFVKPLAGIPYLGPALLTGAAALQLFIPLRRCDALERDLSFVGLHWRAWREDLRWVLVLCAVCFPPYILGYHLYATQAHDWLTGTGWEWLARYAPKARFDPRLPTDAGAAAASAWWFAKMSATHLFGVALPEETFYRGYLQPRLQRRLPPARRILGAPMGRATALCCGLFALGHFLGEWNPLRLGPFFPALVFAWQRNRTGSVMGAIAFHAACNILGEVLFALYR